MQEKKTFTAVPIVSNGQRHLPFSYLPEELQALGQLRLAHMVKKGFPRARQLVKGGERYWLESAIEEWTTERLSGRPQLGGERIDDPR